MKPVACKKCGLVIWSFEALKGPCRENRNKPSGKNMHVLNMLDIVRLPDKEPSI